MAPFVNSIAKSETRESKCSLCGEEVRENEFSVKYNKENSSLLCLCKGCEDVENGSRH